MTVVSPTLLQGQIGRTAPSGDPYESLSRALAVLQTDPLNHAARLLGIRNYLSLHLVLPAKGLMEAWPGEQADSREWRELRSTLRRLPGGAAPWSQFREQFEKNLAVVAARGWNVAAIREASRNLEMSGELFQDRNANWHLRTKQAGGQWQWILPIRDYQRGELARPMPEDIESRMPGPYLFDGIGCGAYLESVYEATLDTFLGYSCALYVLEPNTEWLAMQLHLHDWAIPLGDARVMVFFGVDCCEGLERAWDDDYDLPWPREAFSFGDQPSDVVQKAKQAACRRQQAILDSLSELQKQYADRSLPHWAKRFAEAMDGGGRPLRILSAVSTHTSFLQHSLRDARRALESLGYEVRVLIEDRPFTIIGPLTYHTAIREFDPDVFLMFDHLRPESEAIIPQNLPILTWDQDQLPHVFTPQNLARIAPHDFIAGCSKFHCVSLGCNPRQLINSRIPACPEQFSGIELSDEELAKYTCDVSYVSHASQTPRAFHDEERSGYSDPAVGPLLDVMYELLPEQLARYRVVDGGVMSSVLDEACRRRGVTYVPDDLRARLTRWYLWRLGDRIFRHEALEWVAAWARKTGRSFRIYGNGWDRHPTLAEFAAGPAGNGRELLCVYRASRINLQLMPAGFVHQRSLDGLCAGGFFLSRQVPDDLRGRTLRSLVTRIDELKIQSTRQLLTHEDDTIQTLLQAYVGERLDKMDHYRQDLLTLLRVNAELVYPEEVFPQFSEVLFDSAAEFEARAEVFLDDAPRRHAVAAAMRTAVIEHYSYRSTMEQFLREMTKYLQWAAGQAKKEAPQRVEPTGSAGARLPS